MRRALAAALTWPLAGAAVDAGVAAAAVERRDAIVVLGAPLAPDGALGAVLAERVAVAVALWRAGAAPVVAVTGGRTCGAARAEADAMAEALLAAGVPASAIVVDDQALTTADNAARVRALLPAARTVWLTTQRFHARRAARLFGARGMAARVVHAADGLAQHDPGRALRWAVREYGAWVRVFARVLLRPPGG